MITTTRLRHCYDHRLRDLVRSTGNIEYATRRCIPRSTARGWLSAKPARVVTLDVVDQDRVRLAFRTMRGETAVEARSSNYRAPC